MRNQFQNDFSKAFNILVDIFEDFDLENVNSTTISDILTQLKFLGDNNKFPPKVNCLFEFACHFLLLQDAENGTLLFPEILITFDREHVSQSFKNVSWLN